MILSGLSKQGRAMRCKQGFWIKEWAWKSYSIFASNIKKKRAREREKKEWTQAGAQERWAGGIMGYCEFRPTGNGRPASNPTALARYLQHEQCCLQVTQNLLLCCSGLRFLIIAPFFTHRAHLNVPIIYSVTYSHLLSCAIWFYECSLKRSHTSFFFFFLSKNKASFCRRKLHSCIYILYYFNAHFIPKL